MLAITKSRFHNIRKRLENYTPPAGTGAVWEFFLFGFKQGWACLFGGILLILLLLTKYFWPENAWLARYDFLFLCACLIQVVLIMARLETIREAKVIFIFHIVGTAMEIFKTDVGSWTYPGNCFFHIGHVPLFSGFMYASVGSYLSRINRIFDMRYTHYPNVKFTSAIAVLIYANFFTHHYMPDIRWALFAAIAVAYRRTTVYYKIFKHYRRMPLLLGFALVTLFIWIGENVGTLTTIWIYPHQYNGWQMVRFGKYGSWFLLMIVSFILISLVHKPHEPHSKQIS